MIDSTLQQAEFQRESEWGVVQYVRCKKLGNDYYAVLVVRNKNGIECIRLRYSIVEKSNAKIKSSEVGEIFRAFSTVGFEEFRMNDPMYWQVVEMVLEEEMNENRFGNGDVRLSSEQKKIRLWFWNLLKNLSEVQQRELRLSCEKKGGTAGHKVMDIDLNCRTKTESEKIALEAKVKRFKDDILNDIESKRRSKDWEDYYYVENTELATAISAWVSKTRVLIMILCQTDVGMDGGVLTEFIKKYSDAEDSEDPDNDAETFHPVVITKQTLLSYLFTCIDKESRKDILIVNKKLNPCFKRYFYGPPFFTFPLLRRGRDMFYRNVEEYDREEVSRARQKTGYPDTDRRSETQESCRKECFYYTLFQFCHWTGDIPTDTLISKDHGKELRGFKNNVRKNWEALSSKDQRDVFENASAILLTLHMLGLTADNLNFEEKLEELIKDEDDMEVEFAKNIWEKSFNCGKPDDSNGRFGLYTEELLAKITWYFLKRFARIPNKRNATLMGKRDDVRELYLKYYALEQPEEERDVKLEEFITKEGEGDKKNTRIRRDVAIELGLLRSLLCSLKGDDEKKRINAIAAHLEEPLLDFYNETDRIFANPYERAKEVIQIAIQELRDIEDKREGQIMRRLVREIIDRFEIPMAQESLVYEERGERTDQSGPVTELLLDFCRSILNIMPVDDAVKVFMGRFEQWHKDSIISEQQLKTILLTLNLYMKWRSMFYDKIRLNVMKDLGAKTRHRVQKKTECITIIPKSNFCSLCGKSLTNNKTERVQQFFCGHRFHYETCIPENTSKCPICEKQPIKKGNEESESDEILVEYFKSRLSPLYSAKPIEFERLANPYCMMDVVLTEDFHEHRHDMESLTKVFPESGALEINERRAEKRTIYIDEAMTWLV